MTSFLIKKIFTFFDDKKESDEEKGLLKREKIFLLKT